jgi:hypothetical protein
MTAEPTTPAHPPRRPRARRPRSPRTRAARELGLKATLLFPDRDIVEKFYVPIIYTACRTCYSEQDPRRSSGARVDGDFDPLKMQKLISP